MSNGVCPWKESKTACSYEQWFVASPSEIRVEDKEHSGCNDTSAHGAAAGEMGVFLNVHIL